MKTLDEKWAELRKVVTDRRAELSRSAANLRLRGQYEDAAVRDALVSEAWMVLAHMDRIDAEGK